MFFGFTRTRPDENGRASGSAVCLLLSVLLGITLAIPSGAYAQPVTAGDGEDLALEWSTLGLPKDITLVGANTPSEYTVRVPAGFSVRRLRGVIHAPVDFGAGFVEITDSAGTFLATVSLPAVVPEQAVVPFDVDISAARANGSELGLSFTVREPPIPAEQRCGLGELVELSDLVTVVAGTEPAPNSVASFFPPVLQRLTIYAPVDDDDAESQAVLTVASAVARMYRPQSPAITVVKQPRGAAPPPAPQFARALVVENGDAGLTVVDPNRPTAYLKLTGRGGQLSDQASILVNQLQSLLQTPVARVDAAGSSSAGDSDELTFGELGIEGESQVLRTGNLTVGVDRSALGAGRVDAMTVHLRATYTPVADLDSASLMVGVNGQAVYSAPLTAAGTVDATFEVPPEFLRQRIAFEFNLAYSPRQVCNPMIAPLTFQLDPRSTVTVTRGGPPLDGFGAVPSEFSPEFLVALDGSSPIQLDYATRVVAAIAQRTGSTLMPRVVAVEDAANATKGALIVANAATLAPTSLRPPIGGESTGVRVDLPSELRADITGGLGSIQVFADTPRNRTVALVTTNGPWALVDPLFAHIDQLPDAWSSLDGDVLAAGPDGTVTDLSIGPAVATSAPPDGGVTGATWLAIGIGAVLVALGLAGAVWWRRRRGVRSLS